MATDERCQPNKSRMANREFVEGEIDRVLNAIDQSTLQERLRKADIAHSSVNSVEDMVSHPALRRIEVQTEKGVIDMPAPPVRRANDTPLYGLAPKINQHGSSIRDEFKG